MSTLDADDWEKQRPLMDAARGRETQPPSEDPDLLQAAIEALEYVEWRGWRQNGHISVSACPSCDARRGDREGHDPACKLARVLAALTAEKEKVERLEHERLVDAKRYTEGYDAHAKALRAAEKRLAEAVEIIRSALGEPVERIDSYGKWDDMARAFLASPPEDDEKLASCPCPLCPNQMVQ